MERAIVGFHQDDALQWVADLECGHTQHVRHEPPWQIREWTQTETGRRSKIGSILQCRLCEDAAEDARMRGLCEDGVAEIVNRARRD